MSNNWVRAVGGAWVALGLILAVKPVYAEPPTDTEPATARPAQADADQAETAKALRQAERDAAVAAQDAAEAAAIVAGLEMQADEPELTPDQMALRDAFTVTPHNVSFNASINFDEQGQPRNSSVNANLNCRVSFGPEVSPMGYGPLTITSVTLPSGHTIRPELDPNRHRGFNSVHRHPGQRQSSFFIYGQLPGEVLSASRMTRVEGYFEVSAARDAPERAVLSPFNRFAGKWVGIEEFPGKRLRVSREGDRFRLEMDRRLWEKMDRVDLLSAKGVSIPLQGWSGGSNGDLQHRTYRVAADDDSRVELWFFRGAARVKVPVVLENVPMPEVESETVLDVVIKLGDDALEAEGPAEVMPEPGGLRVRIEDGQG